jgi:Mg-chelatase subunit ChlD
MARIQGQGSKVKIKGKGDIVFCIDVTGSMQNTIDGVKDNLSQFIANLKTGGQTPLDWRAKAIGYRDTEVDAASFVGLDNSWATTEAEFLAQLDKLEADGGGDPPETLLDALYKIFKLDDWDDSRHKMVVIFTDAPTKPQLNSSVIEPGEDPNYNTVAALGLEGRFKVFYYGPVDSIITELNKVMPRMSIHPCDDLNSLSADEFKDIIAGLAKTLSQASTGVVAGQSTGAAGLS